MPRKKTINLAVPVPLLDEFTEVCRHYGHAKQKGLVLSAAILMFLEADPAEQGRALERILIADVRSGVDALVQRAKEEQARRIKHRQTAAAPDAEPYAKAAKKAGEARKAFPAPSDGE